QGRYGKNRLPSARFLAQELGISRTTVNLAYQELVADGYIVAEPRVGFLVNKELVRQLDTNKDSPITQIPRAYAVNWGRHVRDPSSHRLPEVIKDDEWHRYPYPFIYGQVPTSSFPVAAWNR